MLNLNLLFHKCYYDAISLDQTKGRDDDKTAFESSLERKNSDIFAYRFIDAYAPSPLRGLKGFESFRLSTAYPGLLVGTGYAHGTGIESADADINCGFSFDYVTGQPYIPGSSVKGLLRSGFQHPEVIKNLLNVPNLDVAALERAIFAEALPPDAGKVVFLDAVIASGNAEKHVMGSETITPHTAGITKNPNPIQMLKILPGVVIEFRFILGDVTAGGETVFAEAVKKLFMELLKLFGIGAKTNVGYGMLYDNQLDAQTVRQPAAIKQHTSPPAPVAKSEPSITALKRGDEVITTIVNIKGNELTFQMPDNTRLTQMVPPKVAKTKEKGMKVTLIVRSIGLKGTVEYETLRK